MRNRSSLRRCEFLFPQQDFVLRNSISRFQSALAARCYKRQGIICGRTFPEFMFWKSLERVDGFPRLCVDKVGAVYAVRLETLFPKVEGVFGVRDRAHLNVRIPRRWFYLCKPLSQFHCRRRGAHSTHPYASARSIQQICGLSHNLSPGAAIFNLGTSESIILDCKAAVGIRAKVVKVGRPGGYVR